jgi:hypothetical protein
MVGHRRQKLEIRRIKSMLRIALNGDSAQHIAFRPHRHTNDGIWCLKMHQSIDGLFIHSPIIRHIRPIIRDDPSDQAVFIAY